MYVVGNSITKCLHSIELSTSEQSNKVLKHPGCSTENVIDYIKTIARKKPDPTLRDVAGGI